MISDFSVNDFVGGLSNILPTLAENDSEISIMTTLFAVNAMQQNIDEICATVRSNDRYEAEKLELDSLQARVLAAHGDSSDIKNLLCEINSFHGFFQIDFVESCYVKGFYDAVDILVSNADAFANLQRAKILSLKKEKPAVSAASLVKNHTQKNFSVPKIITHFRTRGGVPFE